MTQREEIIKWAEEQYGVIPDNPWPKYPGNAVLRHETSRKWFALVMPVERKHLGIGGDEIVEVMNVKCDPVLSASVRREAGYFPAYHMNKDSWLTILLDGTVPTEEIESMIDFSFNLTRPKMKKAKKSNT